MNYSIEPYIHSDILADEEMASLVNLFDLLKTWQEAEDYENEKNHCIENIS